MKKIFLLSALFVFAFGGDLFAQDYKKLSRKKLRIEHQKKLNLIDSLSQELNSSNVENLQKLNSIDSLSQELILSNKKTKKLQYDLNEVYSKFTISIDSLKVLKNKIKQLSKLRLADTTINFLWTKPETNINTIYLNYDYIDMMTNQEKAAIAYVSKNIGNECWWANDKAADDRSNLDCKIPTALGLGYQCSESHLGFLRKWFSDDNEVLSHIQDCGTQPETSTIGSYFNKIIIKTKADSISVYCEIIAYHTREHWTRKLEETTSFIASNDNLELIDRDVKYYDVEYYDPR